MGNQGKVLYLGSFCTSYRSSTVCLYLLRVPVSSTRTVVHSLCLRVLWYILSVVDRTTSSREVTRNISKSTCKSNDTAPFTIAIERLRLKKLVDLVFRRL